MILGKGLIPAFLSLENNSSYCSTLLKPLLTDFKEFLLIDSMPMNKDVHPDLAASSMTSGVFKTVVLICENQLMSFFISSLKVE